MCFLFVAGFFIFIWRICRGCYLILCFSRYGLLGVRFWVFGVLVVFLFRGFVSILFFERFGLILRWFFD